MRKGPKAAPEANLRRRVTTHLGDARQVDQCQVEHVGRVYLEVDGVGRDLLARRATGDFLCTVENKKRSEKTGPKSWGVASLFWLDSL